MAGSFTAVDLSGLAAPDVVETLDFETILAGMIADLQGRDTSFSALVESDPAYKILEVCAYRELLVRQRVNEAAKAVMLAFAEGADLDQIAARYDVERLLITPADNTTTPPTAAVHETSSSLRRRVQLSFEGFSTAGPQGAYIFHALGADADVLDVSATSPSPGEVLICVLSRTGDGTAPAETLAAVEAVLTAEDVRPMNDTVVVQSAEIIDYAITATLYTFDGPDHAVVMATAQTAAEDYAATQQRLGRSITLSGVYAALHQAGVKNVALASPAANVTCDDTQAPHCTGINLTWGGTGG